MLWERLQKNCSESMVAFQIHQGYLGLPQNSNERAQLLKATRLKKIWWSNKKFLNHSNTFSTHKMWCLDHIYDTHKLIIQSRFLLMTSTLVAKCALQSRKFASLRCEQTRCRGTYPELPSKQKPKQRPGRSFEFLHPDSALRISDGSIGLCSTQKISQELGVGNAEWRGW